MPTDQKQSPPLDALATPRAAADLAGLDYARVRELIQAGAVRVQRIGRAEYIDVAELERAAAREVRA